MAVAVVAILYVPALLTKRAMRQVVARFYEKKALNSKSALSLAELGLTPPNLLERLTKPRDYKPAALRILQQIGAVELTADGRLFLVEEKLHESLKKPFVG